MWLLPSHEYVTKSSLGVSRSSRHHFFRDGEVIFYFRDGGLKAVKKSFCKIMDAKAAVLYVKINKSGKLLVENRNATSGIQIRHA
jgi:hypothetical protein